MYISTKTKKIKNMDTPTDQNGTQDDFSSLQAETSGSNDKQQVVGYIQNAKNVLITVSSDPSVDELAAALGLTFILNRLDKHATTVFSGEVPQAMEFLDPDKTFEDNVDSLRDFIIALDKEKADKLRYKVEEDVVKIFITPYKTTLKKEDFEFSQGDFNIDVVVALGVSKRDDLDKAITSHGRILHDATVVTINTIQSSSLGVVDLLDNSASSISEIIVAMAESFGSGLLDEQSSTALLTGIVAATNRFSNDKTSPKVMTMAAQLMAAGANQQLIASNLRHEGVISEEIRKNDSSSKQPSDDGELSLDHGDKDSKKTDSSKSTEPSKKKPVEGKLDKSEPKPKSDDTNSKSDGNPATSSVPPLEIPKQATPEVENNLDNQQAPVEERPTVEPPAASAPIPALPEIKKDERRPEMDKPAFGGTLNATTSDAEVAKREAAEREAALNQVALSHDSPQEDAGQVDALAAARQAVEEAASVEEFDPANQPIEAVGAQPLPEISPQQPVALPQAHPEIAQRQMAGPPPVPSVAQPAEEPEPMDAFMQTHSAGVAPPEQQLVANQPIPMPPTSPPLPPQPGVHQMLPNQPQMPPMPPALPSDGSLPQLPTLPGQPQDPATAFQPQTSPDFMQSVNQSQNPWTEAGQNLAAQQANQDAARQQKMDQMTQQYDAAVEKNRELQGLPPTNNSGDHSVFPLPPQ